MLRLSLVLPGLRATQLEPENPIFQFHLGLAYAKTGDKNGARAALTRALSLQANFPGAEDAKQALAAL